MVGDLLVLDSVHTESCGIVQEQWFVKFFCRAEVAKCLKWGKGGDSRPQQVTDM